MGTIFWLKKGRYSFELSSKARRGSFLELQKFRGSTYIFYPGVLNNVTPLNFPAKEGAIFKNRIFYPGVLSAIGVLFSGWHHRPQEVGQWACMGTGFSTEICSLGGDNTNLGHVVWLSLPQKLPGTEKLHRKMCLRILGSSQPGDLQKRTFW